MYVNKIRFIKDNQEVFLTSDPQEHLVDAIEDTCKKFAEWSNISLDEAGTLLMILELEGKLEEFMYQDGQELSDW